MGCPNAVEVSPAETPPATDTGPSKAEVTVPAVEPANGEGSAAPSPPADALQLSSGHLYKVLSKGSGSAPGPQDKVSLNYTIRNAQGKVVDRSNPHRSMIMLMNRLPPGWSDVLQLVGPRGKVRLWTNTPPAESQVVDIDLAFVTPAPTAPTHLTAPSPTAVTTPSGLAYEVLESGSGQAQPQPWDRVTVDYTGWTTDGTIFDSTTFRNQSGVFRLDELIAGWSEALTTMVEGERRRLWIPEDLAYRGEPGKPKGMLVFEVKLLEIETLVKPVPAPPPPDDVGGPPKDAKRTASGLASKVLRRGSKNGKHPTASNQVKVHYTGWSTDGTLFGSSIPHHEPAKLALARTMKGWSEGIQLMVPGEKRRLWIPEELAFAGAPDKPRGMVVIDVELLEIL